MAAASQPAVEPARPASPSIEGLTWWSDVVGPALIRRRSGRGFSYRAPDGSLVRDRATVDRIRALAIPPAWTDVRICPDPKGYLQATGRDARGRKQYRYHPAWRAAREAAKFGQLLEFGLALPRIRERVEADLRRPGMPREKVLALVVRLLELTMARVGNDEYARQNRSFGLTTLTNRHATVSTLSVSIRFRGKSGRTHQFGLEDRRLARLVQRCQELPGRELFEYVDDDGTVRRVRSDDVNAYLRDAADADVTAKMFRTWSATVLACRILRQAAPRERGGRATRRALREALDVVAEALGNTPAVARRSYIHPAVLEAYAKGGIERGAVHARTGGETGRAGPALAWSDEDEAATIALLRRHAREWRGRRARRDGTPTTAA